MSYRRTPKAPHLHGMPTYWTTKVGKTVLITDMDDDHLDATMNFIRDRMGPSILLYEMGAILCLDPVQLNYGSYAKLWRVLCAMKLERERRSDHVQQT